MLFGLFGFTVESCWNWECKYSHCSYFSPPYLLDSFISIYFHICILGWLFPYVIWKDPAVKRLVSWTAFNCVSLIDCNLYKGKDFIWLYHNCIPLITISIYSTMLSSIVWKYCSWWKNNYWANVFQIAMNRNLSSNSNFDRSPLLKYHRQADPIVGHVFIWHARKVHWKVICSLSVWYLLPHLALFTMPFKANFQSKKITKPHDFVIMFLDEKK